MEKNEVSVETLETDQLIDLRTKISLATYVKLSEVAVRKRYKRGIIVDNALSDYLDFEVYCLDKGEYAEYEKMRDLDPSTRDRMEELKKRIEKYERKYKIQYDNSKKLEKF